MKEPASMRPIKRPNRERGAAAVEAALVMFMLVALMTFPIFFARVFWHYTVVQKVAQDAGRYLSTVSMAEMRSPLLAQEAAKVASRIAKEELAALQPGKPIQNSVVQCNLLPCGSQAGITPGTIRIMIAFSVFDTFSGVVDTGRFRLTLTEDVTYSYVGT